jgi:hypothetical protein
MKSGMVGDVIAVCEKHLPHAAPLLYLPDERAREARRIHQDVSALCGRA